MERYRSLGPNDDPSLQDGDSDFAGIDQYSAPENIAPGLAQGAVNIDFQRGDADTRGGFVCLPQLAATPFGFEWTSRTSAADNNWYALAFGNGVFAAVGQSGSGNRVMTSPDGITWATRTSAANNAWEAICWGTDKFVAVSSDGLISDNVMTSPDGITWTSRTSTGAYFWKSVAFGGGVFVAVGYSGVNTTRVMSSTDGITWTDRTPGGIPTGQWWSVTYGNGLFVAVNQNGGFGGSIMTSPTGTTWTVRAAPSSSTWNSVAYGNSLYVAVGVSGAAMYSEDAITWASGTAAASNNWWHLTFGVGEFVAVSTDGTGNRVMRSYDGNQWLSGTSAADLSWRGVAYAAGVFAAVSSSGTGNRVMTTGASTQIFASGSYSDPNNAGERWMVMCGPTSALFFGFGKSSHTVSYPASYVVDCQSTLSQANNYLILSTGPDRTPIRWDGFWSSSFVVMPDTGAGAGFESIPHSDHSMYYVNRLWVKSGKDMVAASDLLDFTTYDDIFNDFNLNIGNSDFVVCTYPFGVESILVFKNRSIQLLTSVAGSLTDVVATEVTRQVGIIGINAVVSVGPDVVYMSDRNINLISLTETSNAVQHKTLPLSAKIKSIMARVNWNVAYKVSMAYWDNKLYVAVPLDGATSCTSILVYNFVTEQWWGEWSFDAGLGMAIQGFIVGDYLQTVRLYAITEDGRAFVTEEGHQDRSGTTVAEISTSLTTRAYKMNNDSRVNRRMWMDLGTWRPSFSVTAYVDGASESEEILSDQTYSRSNSWIFRDSSYDLTNANSDYNRAGRQDYSSICSQNVQSGTDGFLPEQLQEYRLPLITRRKGRLVWLMVESSQGRVVVNGIGVEARAGDRSNFIQVI